MVQTKPWYLSKGAIAGVLGVVITVAQAVGIDQVAGIDKDALSDQIVNIVEGGLYLLALIGRLTAKHTLTK